MIKSIKNIILFSFTVFALLACDMFRIDNYPGPNASLNGGIRDVKTGALVPTDVHNGSRLLLQQLGEEWTTGTLTRVVMQDGQYRDDAFFAGRYHITFNNSNFFPHEIDEIVVNRGDNKIDFVVEPYIRVNDVNIRQEGDEIVATFKLEGGRETVRLANIRLFAGTDIYVGDPFTYSIRSGSGHFISFSPVAVIDPDHEYRLTIDLTNEANKEFFKFKRNYYFRVGAMASQAGVGTIRRNYAQHTVINFNVPQ